MDKLVILHFWHSTKQADEYIQMNQTGTFSWPVCRFRGKPYTYCTWNSKKPSSHNDFILVGVGIDSDIVVGPELW